MRRPLPRFKKSRRARARFSLAAHGHDFDSKSSPRRRTARLLSQPQQRCVLEGFKRCSESHLWQLMMSFYDRKGPESWSQGIVPHFITCNAFIGRSYAKARRSRAPAGTRDMRRPSVHSRTRPPPRPTGRGPHPPRPHIHKRPRESDTTGTTATPRRASAGPVRVAALAAPALPARPRI